MPVRNCGHWLRPAVDSILAQTLRAFELLIIDDGSDDGALNNLPNDARIRILTNPQRGLVNALNHGAEQAQAPFLARMDGDDIALTQRLQTQVDMLRNQPKLGLVAGQVEIFNERGPLAGGYQHYQQWINSVLSPAQIRREIFIESPLPHPTVLMRNTLFKQLGAYHDCAWPEDYDLWLRAFAAGIEMAKPEGVLLRWRDYEQRTSRRDVRYSPAAFASAKAYYLSQTILRQRNIVIWGAGASGVLLHDKLRAVDVPIIAFLDIDSKKIGAHKRALPVYHWQQAHLFSDAIILGAVGARGARQQMRAVLPNIGRTEGLDFWFAC